MGFRNYESRLKSSRILILVLGIQTALIAVRTLNLYLTGFTTPDEVNYVYDIFAGMPYGSRYFFNYQLMGFFKLFSISTLPGFLALFPFYLAFWSFAFIILAYKTLELITSNRAARNFTIFSIPFIVSYSIMSVGVFTEGPGLAMCMLGIYAWLRYAKGERKWYLTAISGASFVAAGYSREPYVIFPLVGALAWIALAATGRAKASHVIIFVLIASLMLYPSNNSPLTSSVGAYEGITTTVATAPSASYGSAEVLGNSAFLFFLGAFLGWNPILFGVSVIAFILVVRQVLRRQLSPILLIIILLSLGTFYGSAIFFYNQVHFLLTQGLSLLIRLSNTAVPAYVLLAPSVYQRLSERKIKILAVVLVILTAGAGGFYVSAVQTGLGLPFYILDFGHQNSPLLARNYFLQNPVNESTLVVLSWDWDGAQLYLNDIPGIKMYPTLNNVSETIKQNFTATMIANYTDSVFLSTRPAVFYVLSEISLSNWNPADGLSSNVQHIMDYQSLFLIKTFGVLYHIDTSHYQQTPYIIDSVQVIFSSPTPFLKVNVSWSST